MNLHQGHSISKAALCLFASVALSGTDFCLAKETKASIKIESIQQTSGDSSEAKKKHLARAVTCFEVAAPREVVWQTLTNFPKYPELFKRIKSCRVTKREGDLVFIESIMKSQLFIKPCQHTINDLAKGPGTLKWRLLDGNFKSVEGEWSLEPTKDGQHCKVTYAIEVEPGMVPQPVVSMFLKVVQKEAVSSVTSVSESVFAEHRSAHEQAPETKG